MEFNLTFREAMKELLDGKTAANGRFPDLYYKFVNGAFRSSTKENYNWENPEASNWEAAWLQECEIKANWGLPKQPRAYNPKQLVCIDMSVSKFKDLDEKLYSNKRIKTLPCHYFDFEYSDQFSKWGMALSTFLELKSHRLAVKSNEQCQFFLINLEGGAGVSITHHTYFTSKLNAISPAFATFEDAEQARTEIGQNKLFTMFKIFQGVDDR